MPLHIREAAPGDAQACLDIYDWYVANTAITFEYETPSLSEFLGRMETVQKKYPWLIAERGGRIVGYAYAGAFHPRAAYNWAAESTIYLDHDLQRAGIGRVLYTALEDAVRSQGILNLCACIGYPHDRVEDEHLTCNSADFHAHMGYRMVGCFDRCGYKFGRWYDMVWMEKLLAPHTHPQPAVVPYPLVSKAGAL